MEGGFRVPAIIRWPGKVPAGKVENGIFSGLDWFPTFVAAAGNPNIVDELKKGKQLGDTTYKVHLDGYDQTDAAHRQGAVEAARDLLLRRDDARRGPHQRLQVPLHRSAERLARRHGQGRLADPRQPAARSVRADRHADRRSGSLAFYNWFAYEFWRFVFVQQEVAKAAQTFLEFPPMQKGASFNLEALKAELEKKMEMMKNHSAQ